MKRSTLLFKSFLVSAFCVTCLTAGAQKLPNVQKTSQRAPADIKIDGKATEWDNKFQAYNHATDVFYTVSNDDYHLYLTVQATDQSIINKIMSGGITFTINKAGKKNDKDGISITYPLFDRKNRPVFGKFSKADAEKGLSIAANTGDSVMNAHNKMLGEKSKLVAVTGVPGLDTLISVYNEDGIKTAELFDSKGFYTYELAIDLKNLGLNVNDAAKFAYHITLNGTNPFNIVNFKSPGNGDGGQTLSFAGSDNISAAKISLDIMQSSSSPTDFWGEYTLARK